MLVGFCHAGYILLVGAVRLSNQRFNLLKNSKNRKNTQYGASATASHRFAQSAVLALLSIPHICVSSARERDHMGVYWTAWKLWISHWCFPTRFLKNQ
jgi:hypothetical protein